MSQPFDLNAWANNSSEQGQAAPVDMDAPEAFDVGAWAGEAFAEPAPEPAPAPASAPPVEEKKSGIGFTDLLKIGAKQAMAVNPVLAYEATSMGEQGNGESFAGTIARGAASAGLALGQAGSALGTTLPATMLKSESLQDMRDLSRSQLSGALEGTPWQPSPPQANPDNPINRGLNAIPGTLTQIGKENAEEYRRWGQEIQAAVPEYRRGKDFIHDPSLLLNPHYLIEGGISAAGSMIPPLLAATVGGPWAAGAVGGAMEGLPFLQDIVDTGVMPDEALVRSGAYGTASAAMNAFSFGKMLDVGVNDALKLVGAKILAASGIEGFTEWLEGPVQALAEHMGTMPIIKTESTMTEDMKAGLGKAFKPEEPASLFEAVAKAGREEAPVIPGAILTGGGISAISQLTQPTAPQASPPVPPVPPAPPVPPVPPAPPAPEQEPDFGFDLLRAGDDPQLDSSRQGVMNALAGLQAQGLQQEAMPKTPDQQVIEQQVGISAPPARPAGYYEQPIIGPEQIQEFEQGMAAQAGPTELLGPDDTLSAEWQARQADQDAVSSQAQLEAEWKARQQPQAQAPATPASQDQNELDAKSTTAPSPKQQEAVDAWQTALDATPEDDTVGRTKAEWMLRQAKAGRGVPLPPVLVTEDLDAEWQARLDAKANEAATSPLNDRPDPTPAQVAAGNYKKGPLRIHGLEISVENPAGSVRRGTNEDGKAWETEMRNHYGYIKGTKGADKEHLDTFVGPNPNAENVFVVNQNNPKTGEFDEHKVMLGFENEEAAKQAYLSNYEPGWNGMGEVASMTVAEFKDWSKKPRLSKRPAAPAPVVAAPAVVAAPVAKAKKPMVKKTAPLAVAPTVVKETPVTLPKDAPKENKGPEYSTAEDTPGVTTRQVRDTFPKALVKETKDGWEVAHGGTRIKVNKVGEIRVDEDAFEKTYGRKATEDERALGSFAVVKGEAIISLTEEAGDATLFHEAWHAAERMALTPKEVKAVEAQHGDSESRANTYAAWLKDRQAQTPVRKIFQKIFDFFSRIKAVFHKNAGDVFREVSTGRAFEKGAKAKDSKAQYQSLSTRLPSAVKATEDPLNELLVLDFGLALEDAKTLEKNMEALSVTPNMRKLKGKGSRSAKAQAEAFVNHAVDNLLFLHDAMDESLRKRAKLWYDGGRKTVEAWANRYGISEMQSAALIAVLSPQNPWYANVSQAERIADIIFGMRDFAWTKEMDVEASRITKEEDRKSTELMNAARGKTLGELLDRPEVAARWIRVYDQTHNSRAYRVLTPEGGVAGFVQTNKGEDGTLTWNGYLDIAKAVSVLLDGRAENAYYQIGQEHKVRNFYNNLFDPTSPLGFVTIDTHAVAAALLRPLSGNDLEVKQAFGSAGSSSSSFTGMNGTYPLYAEAYRRAAEARGLLPREMQSITWEAVRGLFEASKKSGMKTQANTIWERYKSGEIEQGQAHQEITALAKGITPPSWADVPYTDTVGRTYSGPAQKAVDKAGPAGSTPAEKTRVFFEVAPDPNDEMLTEEWNALPQNAKHDISQRVAASIVPLVLKEIGVSGSFDMQLGGYEGATNPSMALLLGRPELLVTAAKTLGFSLSQDSMMIVSEREVVGTQPVGAVTIELPDGYGAKEVEALYDRLWPLEKDGQKLVGGHTTAGGFMTVLNYSGVDTTELERLIYGHLGGDFTVSRSNLYSSFIDKKEYQYGQRDNEGTTATPGRAPIQGRMRNLRREASRLLREALDARGGGGVQYQTGSVPVRAGGKGVLRVGDVGSVRASYGEQKTDGGSVVGIHYSREARESLSGDFYGTGIKGAEARRVALSSDNRLAKRIHFYVDTGQGIRPEPGVGANIHAVNLHNLYNTDLDPRGLKAAAYADRMVDPNTAFNNLESAILDAGFDGIYVPQAQSTKGVAVLLGDHTAGPVDLVQSAPQYQTSAFYSAVERAIESMDFKAMPAADLANRIGKLAGIKAEELEDLGLQDWLAGMGKDKVSKDQVLEFVKQGGPQIEEVQKGREERTDAHEKAYNMAINQLIDAGAYDNHATTIMDAWFRDPNQDNTLDAEELFIDNDLEWDATFGGTVGEAESSGSTKFSQYQMPGGKNYREVLLTLPTTPVNTAGWTAVEGAGDLASGPVWEVRDSNKRWVIGMPRANAATADAAIQLAAAKYRVSPSTYTSTHWDEQNVLAHFRVNDRTGPNGEKILFVEEIQSDWHQEGRKKGYKKPGVKTRSFRDWIKDSNSPITPEEMEAQFKARKGAEYAKWKAEADIAAANIAATPNAPFKKSWSMLAFKRVLRMAAEQGYDSVAWTPGEVQADRYDISKQVDRLEYLEGADYSVLHGYWEGEKIIVEKIGGVKNLADYIGKDLAAKLENAPVERKSEGGKNVRSLSGVDLKVGGEGMKGFYDRILPAEVNKYAKKWGVKVETTSVPVSGGKPTEYADFNDYMAKKDGAERQVWSLPITDAMREDIMKGQPLYQEPKKAEAKAPSEVDIKATFPWADSVETDGDGRTVVTVGKNSFAVTKVESITPDLVSFKIQYKRAFDAKTDTIAGTYREGEIQLSKIANRWTLMHEYYHALEDMGLVAKMEQAILDVAAKKAGGYTMTPSENRAYFVQDQLESRSFDRKTPAGRVLQKIADTVDSFVNLFTRTTRGIVRDVESGKVMKRDASDAVAQEAQYALAGVRAAAKTKIDYLRMKFQDKFIPLLRVQEKLVEDGWVKTDEADAYRAEELFSGKAGARLEKFQKNKVGRLLEAIKASRLSLVEVEDYLYAKYAPQRNAYIASINPAMPDGGSGHTDKWAADKLADFQQQGKTARLDAIARIVRAMNQMQRDIIRNEGLEEDDTVDAWEQANPDYVPLKGGKEETKRTIGTGFNIKGSGTKRAMGRKSPASDILAHMFAQVGDTIIRAEKAKVGRAFLKMVEQNPNVDMWRLHDKLPTKRTVVKGVVKNVVDLSFPKKDNVLTVTLDDASVQYIEMFDDDLARVMKNLTPGQHGAVTQAMATFTRFLSMVNTSLNPEFVLTNLERDLMTAMINLSGEQSTAVAKKVFKSLPAAMRGIHNHLRGDGSKDWAIWYERFKDAGGQISFMDLRGVEQIKEDIEAMISNSSGSTLAKGKMAIQKLLKYIGDMNTVVENAARLATFRTLIEEGVSESDAASAAKNLTVNFNRKGELGPAMNALYMFFNAGVQGSARIMRALGNPRVRKIVAGITLMAFGLAELNALMGGDDDDDEKKWDKHASEWTRQTNLILMRPDGDMYKIKMPYGYNFFVALGYTLSDVRRWGSGSGGKNPAEAATFLFKTAMNAFNPMGDDSFLQMLAPTVLDPFLQIATNENFMGTKIAPTQAPWGPPKPNSQLAFRSVSKPAKAFAEYVNSLTSGDKWNPGSVDISPEWIDHITDFLTGGLGRTARDVFSLPATLMDPDLAVQRVPFLRQVYQQKNTRIDMERLYDNVQAIGTAKAMFDEAPIKDREAFKAKHPEIKLWKPSEGIKNRFSDLRKQMYELEDKGDRAGAKVIEEQMRQKALEFNKKFNGIKRGLDH